MPRGVAQRAGEEVAAKGGPRAAGLLAAIMDHNAREYAAVTDRIEESLKRELEEWKARALDAERRLYRIEGRLTALLD